MAETACSCSTILPAKDSRPPCVAIDSHALRERTCLSRRRKASDCDSSLAGASEAFVRGANDNYASQLLIRQPLHARNIAVHQLRIIFAHGAETVEHNALRSHCYRLVRRVGRDDEHRPRLAAARFVADRQVERAGNQNPALLVRMTVQRNLRVRIWQPGTGLIGLKSSMSMKGMVSSALDRSFLADASGCQVNTVPDPCPPSPGT